MPIAIIMKLQEKETLLLPEGLACTQVFVDKDPVVRWTSRVPDGTITILFPKDRTPLSDNQTMVKNEAVTVERKGLFPYDVLLTRPGKPDQLFPDGGALDVGPHG